MKIKARKQARASQQLTTDLCMQLCQDLINKMCMQKIRNVDKQLQKAQLRKIRPGSLSCQAQEFNVGY